MLSHRERQALAEIERGLTDTDPGLARRLQRPPAAPCLRWVPAVLAVALGLMVLLAVLSLPIAALASAAAAVVTVCVPALATRRRRYALRRG